MDRNEGISSNSAVAGFDGRVEDEIPYTYLNVCHKNTVDRRRCFLYSYQITLKIRDSVLNPVYPMIVPTVYFKISFK